MKSPDMESGLYYFPGNNKGNKKDCRENLDSLFGMLMYQNVPTYKF